jgi:hypothetical protein
MVWVAIAALVCSLSLGYRTTYLSCHLCHDRKRVESRLFLGFPVSWRETAEAQFGAAAHHRHVWSRYSVHNDLGPLGGGVACRHCIYLDGSRAPDGRR